MEAHEDPAVRIARMQDEAAQKKRAAWERLPPDHRQFLNDMTKAFGKPTAIAIRFRDGERYQSGRFGCARSS